MGRVQPSWCSPSTCHTSADSSTDAHIYSYWYFWVLSRHRDPSKHSRAAGKSINAITDPYQRGPDVHWYPTVVTACNYHLPQGSSIRDLHLKSLRALSAYHAPSLCACVCVSTCASLPPVMFNGIRWFPVLAVGMSKLALLHYDPGVRIFSLILYPKIIMMSSISNKNHNNSLSDHLFENLVNFTDFTIQYGTG